MRYIRDALFGCVAERNNGITRYMRIVRIAAYDEQLQKYCAPGRSKTSLLQQFYTHCVCVCLLFVWNSIVFATRGIEGYMFMSLIPKFLSLVIINRSHIPLALYMYKTQRMSGLLCSSVRAILSLSLFDSIHLLSVCVCVCVNTFYAFVVSLLYGEAWNRLLLVYASLVLGRKKIKQNREKAGNRLFWIYYIRYI